MMTSTPKRSKTPDSQAHRRSTSPMTNISLTRKEDWQRFVTAPAQHGGAPCGLGDDIAARAVSQETGLFQFDADEQQRYREGVGDELEVVAHLDTLSRRPPQEMQIVDHQ